MTDTTTVRTLRTEGELHYRGRVDPTPGQLMGPDLHGRVWEVTGAVYDPDTTTVHTQIKDFTA